MSISAGLMIAFVAVAVIVKVSALTALGVSVLARRERFPVWGRWILVSDEIEEPAHSGGSSLSPGSTALRRLLDSDMSRIEIAPSRATVTVRSADGQTFNYGRPELRVIRLEDRRVRVHATWCRDGDVLRLQSHAEDEDTIVEAFQVARSELAAELSFTARGAEAARIVTRWYRRDWGDL